MCKKGLCKRCFFILSQAWDKEKILSPCKESNLRPLVWCSNVPPLSQSIIQTEGKVQVHKSILLLLGTIVYLQECFFTSTNEGLTKMFACVFDFLWELPTYTSWIINSLRTTQWNPVPSYICIFAYNKSSFTLQSGEWSIGEVHLSGLPDPIFSRFPS